VNEKALINYIQKVRAKNNVLWMQLLKVAIKNDPDTTKAIMKKIRENDLTISELTGELSK